MPQMLRSPLSRFRNPHRFGFDYSTSVSAAIAIGLKALKSEIIAFSAAMRVTFARQDEHFGIKVLFDLYIYAVLKGRFPLRLA